MRAYIVQSPCAVVKQRSAVARHGQRLYVCDSVCACVCMYENVNVVCVRECVVEYRSPVDIATHKQVDVRDRRVRRSLCVCSCLCVSVCVSCVSVSAAVRGVLQVVSVVALSAASKAGSRILAASCVCMCVCVCGFVAV